MTNTLAFGTAGMRGPMRPGPGGMNEETVVRATAGLAAYLHAHGEAGHTVVIGRDARHGSALFARAAAEVLAAAGFEVTAFDEPLPTPVTAFAVRDLDAAAGVQITASHNPAGDNGYKVYLRGGAQLVPPADAGIEAAIRRIGPAADVPRRARGSETSRSSKTASADVVERYRRRAASAGMRAGGSATTPTTRPLRIALTPMHGVGGATVLDVLARAGFTDVHMVAEQAAPDPDFPTVAFPNPEEPGATDLLLRLADRVDADLAVALDPDADRCAIGVRLPADAATPPPDGSTAWRMLRGDEAGTLLGEQILAEQGLGEQGLGQQGLGEQLPAALGTGGKTTTTPLVATTIVSSTLLGRIAAARGAEYRTTLTGFKWLVRAGDNAPGCRLVYAYEEAIGLCVDPDAVRDKDGISAAVALCAMVDRLRRTGRTVGGELDRLAREFGVHAGRQVSARQDRSHGPTGTGGASTVMRALRHHPPTALAGTPVACEDLLARDDALRTDGLILAGDSGTRSNSVRVRVVIRPSGTEPKVKAYIEVIAPPAGQRTDPTDLTESRRRVATQLDAVAEEIRRLLEG